VLVIEDEEGVRAFTKAALERTGYKVLLAENGRQALELLAGPSGVDLAVLDLVMPVVGGVEAFAEMRNKWPKLAVLVASGYSRQEAKRLGIPGDLPYIEKPYTAQMLAAAVAKALKGHARKRE
jgi:DNA-binding NtrC family response regulator